MRSMSSSDAYTTGVSDVCACDAAREARVAAGHDSARPMSGSSREIVLTRTYDIILMVHHVTI